MQLLIVIQLLTLGAAILLLLGAFYCGHRARMSVNTLGTARWFKTAGILGATASVLGLITVFLGQPY